MSGDEGRNAFESGQVKQALEHIARCIGIKVSGRLVGQQDFGFIGNSAGDSDALLLPAGTFVRVDGAYALTSP